MEKQNRTTTVKFRVNEAEYAIIKKRMKACRVKSMSMFIRQMIVHGIYLEFNQEELKKDTHICFKHCEQC